MGCKGFFKAEATFQLAVEMTVAVLLCAGRGTRLWPVTSSTPKALVRIMGKPIVDWIAQGIAESGGVEKIIVVVSGDDAGREVEGHLKRFGSKVEFAVQRKQLGTADAVLAAAKAIGGSDFLVINADTFFQPSFYRTLAVKLREKQPFIVGKKVDDASPYGLLQTVRGKLAGIVEKPEEKTAGVINTGVYYCRNDFLQALRSVKKSARGELEATEALGKYAKSNAVEVLEYDGYWNDIGYFWNYLDASAFALEHVMREGREGAIEPFVNVKGKLFLGKGAVVKSGTYIEGPAYIGDNCTVGPSAYIRPHSFLEGDNHVGNSTEIKNSIILRGANAAHLSYVADSIICEEVNLGGGTIVANLRFDEAEIPAEIKGERVSSRKRKLGAVIGKGAKTGVNVSINCGVLIGERCRVHPHSYVLRNMEDGSDNSAK